MAIAAVKNASGVATTATVNPAFGSATTAGNLIVLSFSADDYNITPDTGWTQSGVAWDGSNPSASAGIDDGIIFHGTYIWWRISTGETSFTYTIDSATSSSWVLSEWSGVHASPFDIVSAQYLNSAATSYTTPAIAPSTGERLLIGHIGGWSNSSNLDSTWSSILNSFTEVNHNGNASGNKTGTLQVSRIVTGDGSTTFSTGATYPNSASPASRSGIIIAFKAAGTGTTLTAAAGSYSFTGTTASLKHGWKPTASAGSYAFSGTNANLTKSAGAQSLAVSAGSYLFIGDTVVVQRDFVIPSGSYAFTGSTANLLHMDRLTAAAGSYAFTGSTAALNRGKRISVTSVGSYSFTGANTTNLTKVKMLSANAGSYTFTGTNATLFDTKKMTVTTGIYAFGGNSVNLIAHGVTDVPTTILNNYMSFRRRITKQT